MNGSSLFPRAKAKGKVDAGKAALRKKNEWQARLLEATKAKAANFDRILAAISLKNRALATLAVINNMA